MANCYNLLGLMFPHLSVVRFLVCRRGFLIVCDFVQFVWEKFQVLFALHRDKRIEKLLRSQTKAACAG